MNEKMKNFFKPKNRQGRNQKVKCPLCNELDIESLQKLDEHITQRNCPVMQLSPFELEDQKQLYYYCVKLK